MGLSSRIKRRLIPKNRWGDRYLSRRMFIERQGRPPSKDGGLNDFTYFMKTGTEALRPLRAFVSCKEQVKQFVRDRVGDQHNVPTLAILKTIDEAQKYNFPDNCVIKPTHMSGAVHFRRNASPVDFGQIDDWLKTNYYNWTREITYRNLTPKIIVEPFIFGAARCDDYKIFCVNGEPRLMWVDVDRQIEHRRNLYTTDWTLIPAQLNKPNGRDIPKPKTLDKMLEIARALSCEFSFIRVDLYTDDEAVLVGELTNFPGDARNRFLSGEETVTNILFGEGGIRPIIDQFPAT